MPSKTKRSRWGSVESNLSEAAVDAVRWGGPSLDRTSVMAALLPERDEAVVSSGGEPTGLRPGEGEPPRAVRILREGTEPLVVPLYPDRNYRFGRAPDSSVVFPSDAVSRYHLLLRFDGEGRWSCRDLNSRNGTFVLDGEAPSGVDARAAARRLGPLEDHLLKVGQTLLLGSGKSRLTLLDELPTRSGVSASGGWVSAATQKLERDIAVCARHRFPVFLLGASGTGKTFWARRIHEQGRMSGHFVLVNCGRLPHDPAQLTSELLGHVRGSFTGALAERKGKFWSADGGTLFLDEVESLPRVAQDFLLDVLEGTGSCAPYGSSGDGLAPPPQFRLLSASKAPLAQSGLRPDLCQRLAVGELLTLPSLDERREDIPALVDRFLERLRGEQRMDAELTPEAVRFLQSAAWPGEVRELESTVNVVVGRLHAREQLDGTRMQKLVVGVDAVRTYLAERRRAFGHSDSAPPRKRPEDLTADELRTALTVAGGNKTRAAAMLGIALNTLKAKLRRAGLER